MPENEQNRTECPKDPQGIHHWGPMQDCLGSYQHNDPGGPIFTHHSQTCTMCGKSYCWGWGEPDSVKIDSGWY